MFFLFLYYFDFIYHMICCNGMEKELNQQFTKIDKKLDRIDQKFEQVDKRFDQVDKRFEQIDKRFEQIDERFDQVDKKFAEHEDRFDLIARTLVEHSGRLEWLEENVVTKKDHQEVINTLDTIVGMMKKRDEETTMAIHALQRHEEEIGGLQTDMSQVKPLVGLQ